MPDTPFGPLKQESRPTRDYVDIASALVEQLPEFRTAVWEATYDQLALVSQVASDASTHESVRLIFNLAVNDFRDLLDDLDGGSGRSAMRAARAVIEHAINLHTVAGSLAEASRYVEHLDQGPAIMRDLATGIDRLAKGPRRSYRHMLNKLGSAAACRFNAALAEHGSWFQRTWTQRNLRDRAERFGLDQLYEYYRLASLVTHGSAGGSVGIIRDHRDGFRVFRTGPAIELAPVAMWAGVAGYREVMAALQTVRPDLDVDSYKTSLDALDALWADYFTTITEIDRSMWPEERVRAPSAVLAFNLNKARRWYLHLPMSACLIPAMEPDVPDWVEEQVASLIDTVVAEQPQMFRPDQRWVTATFLHVTVVPEKGARPIPDTALMEFPADGWEPQVVDTGGENSDTP